MPEWSKGQVRALAARRGVHGVATVSGGDLYIDRGGGRAKSSVTDLQHATPHGTSGNVTPHDKIMKEAHSASKDKAAAGGAMMTGSKGGKYKISPSGKKEYVK